MVTKTFEIQLDLKQASTNPRMIVVGGDTANFFHVTLTDDGVPVDLTDCRVIAIFSTADGIAAQDGGSDEGGVTIGGLHNNEITIELFNGSYSYDGLTQCELQIYSGADMSTLATSAKFSFRANRPILNDESIVQTREFPVLTSLIRDVFELQEQGAAMVTAEENRVAAEASRVSAEQERAAAESARTAAETARASAESARTVAEGARETAEQERAAAESTRESSEQERVAAEQAREISSSAAIENANTAAAAANQAAQQALAKTQPDWDETDPVSASYIKNKPSSFAPNLHAASHASNGSDAITPGSIGAEKARLERTATLQASAWVSNAQTIPVSGVTVSSLVVVSAAPASHVAYGEAGVYCSVQAEGSLTFSCSDVPTVDLSVNVVIWG